MNIPFNQGSRILTFTSTEIRRNAILEELKAHFRKQQYPDQAIDYGTWKELIKRPTTTESRRFETTADLTIVWDKFITFVTLYNPRDDDILSFKREIEIIYTKWKHGKNLTPRKWWWSTVKKGTKDTRDCWKV